MSRIFLILFLSKVILYFFGVNPRAMPLFLPQAEAVHGKGPATCPTGHVSNSTDLRR